MRCSFSYALRLRVGLQHGERMDGQAARAVEVEPDVAHRFGASIVSAEHPAAITSRELFEAAGMRFDFFIDSFEGPQIHLPEAEIRELAKRVRIRLGLTT